MVLILVPQLPLIPHGRRYPGPGLLEILLHGLDEVVEGPLRVFARADIDTLAAPADIRAVVGIFLFRKPNALLESLPLVRSFLPGSERGLIDTYFEVEGPIAEPEIEALPLQTLMTSVPDVIKAPFKVLRRLFEGPENDS